MTISARNHKIPIQKRKSRKLIVFREGGGKRNKAARKAAEALEEKAKKEENAYRIKMQAERERWRLYDIELTKELTKNERGKEEKRRDERILKYIEKEFKSVIDVDNKREYKPAIPYCEWLEKHMGTEEKRYNHIKGIIKRDLYSELIKFENKTYDFVNDLNYSGLLNTDLYGYTDTDRDRITEEILRKYKKKIYHIIKDNCPAHIMSDEPDEPDEPDDPDDPDEPDEPDEPDDDSVVVPSLYIFT